MVQLAVTEWVGPVYEILAYLKVLDTGYFKKAEVNRRKKEK